MKKIQAAILVTPILSAVLLLHVSYLRFVCDDAFISFRGMVFPLSISANEAEFLYGIDLKESRSQRVEDSRFRVEEAKDGK